MNSAMSSGIGPGSGGYFGGDRGVFAARGARHDGIRVEGDLPGQPAVVGDLRIVTQASQTLSRSALPDESCVGFIATPRARLKL